MSRMRKIAWFLLAFFLLVLIASSGLPDAQSIFQNVVEAADAHNGLLTALFTGVLTVFTIGLWQETRRLAKGTEEQAIENKKALKAAQKSADAADLTAKAVIGVELPILRVTKVSSLRDAMFAQQKEEWIREFYPHIEIKNFGRTTAFVNDFQCGFSFAKSIPAKPVLVPIERYMRVVAIEPGETQKIKDFQIAAKFSSQEIAAFLADEESNFSFFGSIYFTDFLGRPHSQGWLFTWVSGNDEFAPVAHLPAYTEQT